MVIGEWLGITIRVKINISTFGSYLLSVTRIIESTKLARQIMLSSKLYHLEKFGENVNHCPVTGAIPVPGIPATPEEQISKTNLLITFAFSSYQLTYFTLFFCTFILSVFHLLNQRVWHPSITCIKTFSTWNKSTVVERLNSFS